MGGHNKDTLILCKDGIIFIIVCSILSSAFLKEDINTFESILSKEHNPGALPYEQEIG